MVFEMAAGCVRTTLLQFRDFVLCERHELRSDILLMSFNTFDEIDLLGEVDGDERAVLRRLVQLSLDDQCTVFCAVKTSIDTQKSLSVVVAHAGRLCDIVHRTRNLGFDDYVESDKLKIYDTKHGKIAILIDSDGVLVGHWQKIQSADYVFCFATTDKIAEEIELRAKNQPTPTIILTPTTTQTINL